MVIPHPHTRRRFLHPPPPPPVPGERGTLACGRGGRGSQFQRGDRHCGTLRIFVLCFPTPNPVDVIRIRLFSAQWSPSADPYPAQLPNKCHSSSDPIQSTVSDMYVILKQILFIVPVTKDFKIPKIMRIHTDPAFKSGSTTVKINRDLIKPLKLRKQIHRNIEVDVSCSRKPVPGLRRKFQRCEHWSPLQ